MGLHVIIGEDDYRVGEIARKVIGDGVGLEVIDSNNSGNEETRLRDIREADASFSTPPFLDPRKVTWWKNVGFLPSGGGKRGDEEKVSEAVKEALERFTAKLVAEPMPENQEFILSGPKLMATSVIAKRLKAAGEFVSFAAGKPWEARRNAVVWAIDAAKELGLAFADQAAEAFVDVVGTDSRSIVSELGKMRDFLGAGNTLITRAAIDEITSQGVGVEPTLWSVTDAVGARNLPAALEAIRRFEAEKGFAIMMTTVLERFFRELAELKDAQEKGKTALATEGMAPFAAKKSLGFCAYWRLNELRAARARFMRLREQAVTVTDNADVLVVAELVRTIGVPRRRT